MDWPGIHRNAAQLDRQVDRRAGGFQVAGHARSNSWFLTRCDTLFGATYCVLAPEHALVDQITTPSQKAAIEEYKRQCATKSDLERTELSQEKPAFSPARTRSIQSTASGIPIWISDYVLATYGTGAIMAVPAHAATATMRFAEVWFKSFRYWKAARRREAWTQDGVHISSEFLNGMNRQMRLFNDQWLSEHHCGQKKVNYRLREWFSPPALLGQAGSIVHLDNGDTVALSDNQLPLLLPDLNDYSPSKTGASPLEKAPDWVNVK